MPKLSTYALAGALAFALAPVAGYAADLPEPPLREPTAPVEFGSAWYLRGDVGYKVYRDPKARYDNPAFAGNQSFSKEKMGDAAVIGGGVGYKFNNWFRADVTADYETPSKFRGRLFCPGACAGGTTQEKAKIDAVTIFANGYFDIATFNGFTPYVGGGVGAAYLDIDHYRSNSVGNPSYKGDSDWNFAWNVTAGVGFQVSDNLVLDANYRFVDLGQVKTKSIPAAGSSGKVKVDDIQAHEFRVGFRYLID
ncbi:outer membrane protein [Hansschlegelia zhihuaiae]|uniref:Porin family protein n=1 Tax=Hansschlegelia zhihuaiae TaxID=405005 RepID=A0A4Q0MP25_9HYPH|nr:outer membrane protein [Hansschlegelia zhihuaiae]RXF75484.1 porin family protein [Hansschlegelia zhihuaiae]